MSRYQVVLVLLAWVLLVELWRAAGALATYLVSLWS